MIDVVEILHKGSFTDAADRIVLDHDNRLRRRIVLQTSSGEAVRLNAPKTVQLNDGDGLKLADGRIIVVESKPEPLLEITAHSLAQLVRIAWHLGNRHLPTQLLGDRLRIRYDHVIADMVEGLGGHATPIEAAFDPEGGAYAGGGGHHDHDDHHHDHAHDHGHEHA